MTLRMLGVAWSGLLIVGAVGCGGGARDRVPPTTASGATTSATVVRPAGESLGLSEEIVRLCDLQVGGMKAAPKYDFDRSELQPADRATLDKVAECLTTGALRGRTIRLIGRADARGETDYNMVLGAQRAGGVADYLAHLGVERTRLDVTSRGELDAGGTSEAGWAADRRVDIVLAR
jgi:peptidoglycan-associated lipoprotein